MLEALVFTLLSLSSIASAYKVFTLEDKVERNRCKCTCNIENYVQRPYFDDL